MQYNYNNHTGIPHLVVLNEELKVVNDNGRAMVERDPEAKVSVSVQLFMCVLLCF